MSHEFKAQGGIPITPAMAVELRQVVFGTSAVPMRPEWTQTPFVFGPSKSEFSYGLRSSRNATRGLLSVVQGFILKHLLFSHKPGVCTNPNPLKPTTDMQRAALIAAIVEILRSIADKGNVIMVLPSPDNEIFVEHSAFYFHDTITEKLYLFTLNPHDELEFFIQRNYKYFTEEGTAGTLLLLYSAVLTRSFVKIRNDLDTTKQIPLTMANQEEGSLMIVTLLLTGRATPYLHNGVINVGDENVYAVPHYGVLKRCTIGLLLWENENAQSIASLRQPGSRLKTPNYPIWITSCSGHYGVAFNRNAELLRNYHAEARFDLIYYSCSGCELTLTIDNRSYNEQAMSMLESSLDAIVLLNKVTKDNPYMSGSTSGPSGAGGNISYGSKDENNSREESGTANTPLLKLIHTKWEEAQVSYEGPQPSMLSYLFSTQH